MATTDAPRARSISTAPGHAAASARAGASRAEPPAAPSVASLQEEIAGLRRALETRDPICYAVGVLAAWVRCSPDDAWRLLLQLSQRRNLKVRDLAASVLEVHADGSAPLDEGAAGRVAHLVARLDAA